MPKIQGLERNVRQPTTKHDVAAADFLDDPAAYRAPSALPLLPVFHLVVLGAQPLCLEAFVARGGRNAGGEILELKTDSSLTLHPPSRKKTSHMHNKDDSKCIKSLVERGEVVTRPKTFLPGMAK